MQRREVDDPSVMLSILFGIEGAEVLSFVEDDESEEGAFAILIAVPRVETRCPACGCAVNELDPIDVELPPTTAGVAHVLIVWRRRQWNCTNSSCRQQVIDEESEDVDRFVERVAPRRRPQKLPLFRVE